MTAQTEYRIATPDNKVTTGWKGGKVPTFATWAFFPKGHPNGEGWLQVGWSFQATLADAQKKCLPDFRKAGWDVRATPVLPEETPAAKVVETPAAEIVVHVDMVTPTKGLVTFEGTGKGGSVLNNGRRGSGAGWSAEDGDGTAVGSGHPSMQRALCFLAAALGVNGPLDVRRHDEYRTTGQTDD